MTFARIWLYFSFLDVEKNNQELERRVKAMEERACVATTSSNGGFHPSLAAVETIEEVSYFEV